MASMRKTSAVSGCGSAIVELRQSLSLGQIGFAEALGIDQSTLAKYEKDKRDIPIRVVLRLAEIAPEEHRSVWLQRAGIDSASEGVKGVTRVVILGDAAAAGTPRAVDEKNHVGHMELPSSWFIGCGQIMAVPVKGDSMQPEISTGYLVLVDLQKRSLDEYRDRMVLARVDGGVTVKMLEDINGLTLMPLNVNIENRPIAFKPNEHKIIGRVMRWIGAAQN